MYLYVSSDTAESYFPDNEAADFRARLARPLNLYGKWEVALTEIAVPKLQGDYKPEYIGVNCSVAAESFVDGSQAAILNRVYLQEIRPIQVIRFHTPHYVPVNTNLVYVIHFNLYDNKGEKPSFQSGSLHCALHFRQCLD